MSMNDAHMVLAADGRPFSDRDAAAIKCRRMTRELGDASVKVVEHAEGGFAVAVSDQERPPQQGEPVQAPAGEQVGWRPEVAFEDSLFAPAAAGASTVTPLPVVNGAVSTPPGEAPGEATGEAAMVQGSAPSANEGPRKFGVSPRAFAHLYVICITAAVLSLLPHLPLMALSDVIDLTNEALVTSLMSGVFIVGISTAMYTLSRILYVHVYYAYRMGEEGVEVINGIVSRDGSKVSFGDIRSTKVIQNVWQSLLGVGHVYIGTGATDDFEAKLLHVANPRRLEREIDGHRKAHRRT